MFRKNKVFILEAIIEKGLPDCFSYSCNEEMAVVAKTEQEARQYAHKNSADELENYELLKEDFGLKYDGPWLDPKITSCEEVDIRKKESLGVLVISNRGE